MSFGVPQITDTGKPGKPPIEVFFPAFPQDRRKCVINYLKNYERKTTKYRNFSKESQAPLLIKPHAPVSLATISRWLKTVVALTGVDTNSFQGHSVRCAASHAAKKLGISSDMKVADWSRESTFIKFYHKPTEDTSFGRTVLSSA